MYADIDTYMYIYIYIGTLSSVSLDLFTHMLYIHQIMYTNIVAADFVHLRQASCHGPVSVLVHLLEHILHVGRSVLLFFGALNGWVFNFATLGMVANNLLLKLPTKNEQDPEQMQTQHWPTTAKLKGPQKETVAEPYFGASWTNCPDRAVHGSVFLVGILFCGWCKGKPMATPFQDTPTWANCPINKLALSQRSSFASVQRTL